MRVIPRLSLNLLLLHDVGIQRLLHAITDFKRDGQFKQTSFAAGAQEFHHVLLSWTRNLKPRCPSRPGNPITTPVAQSQVLGKVKDFLGVIWEVSRRLEQEAKDLMLGIADLHTPEAVAAAEAAITGNQPAIPVAASCSETESEYKSEDNESDNQEDAVESDDGASDDFNNGNDDDNKQGFSSEDEKSEGGQDGSNKAVRNNRLKKQPKIVEMS